jgi:hypothetical protein
MMRIKRTIINFIMSNERVRALCLSILLVSGMALVTYSINGVIPYPDQKYSSWDHYKYIAMAQQPFSSNQLVHQAPFCWRILTPWLVHFLPMDFSVSFYLITFLALCFSGYVFYFCMRALKLSSIISSLGVVLFMLVYTVTSFNMWDFYLTDPIGLMFVGISFYFLIVGKDWLLALVMAVGIANKETILIMVPVFFVYLLCRRRYSLFRSVLRTLVVMTPCLIIFLVIRLLIKPFNDYGLGQITLTLTNYKSQGIFYALYSFSFGTWGIILSLFLLKPREKFSLLIKRLDLLVLVLLIYATLLIGNDAGRMLVYAYPVLIPIATLSLLDFSKKTGVRFVYCSAGCILLQILCLMSNFDLGDGVFKHLRVVALFICIAAWFWAEWQLSRANKTDLASSTLSVLTGH